MHSLNSHILSLTRSVPELISFSFGDNLSYFKRPSVRDVKELKTLEYVQSPTTEGMLTLNSNK